MSAGQKAMKPKRSTCSGCYEPIVWAVTENGKRMPLDYEPSEEGTFALVDASTYHSFGLEEGTPVDVVFTPVAVFHKKARPYFPDTEADELELRTSHHATCSRAEDFR